MSNVAQAQEAEISFKIERQRASDGILEYAEQAQVSVLFKQKLVGPFFTNEVNGSYSAKEALLTLLAETGLEGRLTETGTLIIGRCEKRAKINRRCENGVKIEGHGSMKDSKKRYGLRGALLSGAAAFAGFLPSGAAAQEGSDVIATQDVLVVTGTRGKARSVADSPIPIDVFTGDQLEQAPQTGIFESLRYLVPSLNLPQRAGGGTATFIASAGLRGLNPDQTLVLVNGKRRHKTALINTATGLFSGSAGVDLNLIPAGSIQRIEVLRDGAAAQYGSDAIAGVINVILKEDSEGGRITINRGQNFDRADGEFINIGFNNGFALGDAGFLNFSFEFRDKEASNRARPVPIPDPANPGGLNLFPILPGPALDPRELSIDRLVTSNFGNFPQRTYSGGINAGYDLGDVELYMFATYANRSSSLDFTFRRPRDSRAVPEIYPQGFRPTEVIEEDDYEVVAGVRGVTAGFDWDLSAGIGRDHTEWKNTVGLNASLGANSPTSFFLGNLIAREITTSFDATRAYMTGAGELQVSFGLQYRNEAFEIRKGEPLSYADGNNGLAPGAQGFPGFAPEAENDISRDNVNGYVELGWQPTDRFFIGAAGRYENFSDSAGDTAIGKVNARYDLTDSIGFRASFNTGFRAPSIQQLGFKGSRGQFIDLDNDGIAETIVLRQTLPSTDTAAQALGAEPLTPEKSTNISAGFTFTPGRGLSLTIDAYQIDIDDRIALSTQFNRGDARAAQGGGTIGDQISLLLDGAGFDASLGGVNYFTNAIDTRSRGFDIVGLWSADLGAGSLNLSAAFNYNEVTIEGVDPNPTELAGLILADGSPIVQFDRSRLGSYTDEIPSTKGSISAAYENGGFQVNLRGTRFGAFTEVSTSAPNDRFNQAKWIFDAELGYEFDNGFGIYGGANNVFNTYPDETRQANSLGTNFYDTISPYGFTGGSWYIRGAYNW
ncbi:TonB-dependent receptor plug domain-containing protein [Hyphococcus lacteus]|uniref:TonB-dependent receptor n=1 Tax=Hyphococcus lacteus TaxID=3143536 RepID=A0ABV3Z8P5_9PROT